MVKNSRIVLVGILLLGTMLIAGCNAEHDKAQAKNGNIVQVNYTGTLQDGTIFDTPVGYEPLEFTLGEGQVIPGFEQAVLGMKIGESKTVTIPADDAYGPHRDDLILVIDREELPTGLTPEVGQQLQMTRPDGGMIIVAITKVSDKTVTIDANHPLAGKDLTFEIELAKIQ